MNSMRDTIRIIIILGVIGVLAGGAYLLYRGDFGIFDRVATTPGEEVNTPEDEESELSDDLLRTPSQNASTDELREYYQRVEAESVVADEVTIADCVADPAVIKISRGESITFVNTDAAAHTIIMGGVPTYTIEANSTLEVTPEFSQGAGLYAYSCDKIASSVAGVFIVSE